MAKKGIQRKIYFYKVDCVIDENEAKLNEVFDTYIKIFNNDFHDIYNRGLARSYYEKFHFLDISQNSIDKDTYYGKFYSLRSADFPYLFNLENGERQEITNNENETLMEQTHFYCFTNRGLIVSEYNFYGARIERLADYLQFIMSRVCPSKSVKIDINPIVIPEFFKNIINCTSISKLQFKVATPGLKILAENHIIGLNDVANGKIDENTDFYIDIEISGGGKGKKLKVPNLKIFLNNIISAISRGNDEDKMKADGEEPTFKKARVNAYNPSEGKTIMYDLLDEKLVSICWVEKISNKAKYVNSEKMYESILDSYYQKEDVLKRCLEFKNV